MSDPYLDPATGLLRNRLGIADAELLARAEADVIFLQGLIEQLGVRGSAVSCGRLDLTCRGAEDRVE